jgi:hypothetical protein
MNLVNSAREFLPLQFSILNKPPIFMMIAHCYPFVLPGYIPSFCQGYISRNYRSWLKTFALRLAAPPRVWDPFRGVILFGQQMPNR